ncbi:hypothetical protein [Nostoc sp. NOS(2021)]|nr:hypothetical protein [Nostoc sp. NOS(2021)]
MVFNVRYLRSLIVMVVVLIAISSIVTATIPSFGIIATAQSLTEF